PVRMYLRGARICLPGTRRPKGGAECIEFFGEGVPMAHRFKVGDHVSWNSEAGRVRGTIVKVHTRDFDYKGHTRRATEEDPQYEIKSDRTDHIAAHRGSALSKVAG